MPTPPRRKKATAVQNPLETYLRDINETALLTADDEKRLAGAIRGGERERVREERAMEDVEARAEAPQETVDASQLNPLLRWLDRALSR